MHAVETPPSGEQWTIRHAGQEVVIAEIGGGIRQYTRDGIDVVAGYPAHERCVAGQGQLLLPWPGRVRDGRFEFEGHEYQLPLNEPSRGNALHGLVRWTPWTLVAKDTRSLRVAFRLRPQDGWAWSLDVEVAYTLDDAGLTVVPRVRNVGTGRVPFGFGAHPYLTVGEDVVDEIALRMPAGTVQDVDDRLLPVGSKSVDDVPAMDFRTQRRIGTTKLDTTYGGLTVDPDNRWRADISHPRSGRATTLWAAAEYSWAQVFTGDLGTVDRYRRSGVAVEPMTCPPDALNSQEGLIVLAPGEQWSAPWGISPTFP